jgi:hypothetical protein
MSRSRSFSLLRFSGLFAAVSALGLVACAGSDVPLREEGVGGSQSASGATGGTGSGAGGSGGSGSSTGGSGSSTGGTGSSGAGGSGTSASCDGAQILVTNCGASFCHGGGIGTFATSESTLADSVDTPSSGYANTCGSGVLIDSGDATEGVIYAKVSGATCGGQMPPGNALSAADQDCVRSFLADFEN